VILGILFCAMLTFVGVVLVKVWPRVQHQPAAPQPRHITETECQIFALETEYVDELVAVLEQERP
jgi:hypothetical protein